MNEPSRSRGGERYGACADAVTRQENRQLRHRQRRRRVCAAGACLLLVLSMACLALFPVGADTEQIVELPQAQATPSPTPQSVSLEHVAHMEPTGAATTVLAQMVWGEARGCSTTEQAAAIWCALNRVDSADPFFPGSVVEVVTQPGQFHGYDPENPVLPELVDLAEDVLARWSVEDTCVGGVGRVLPKEYLYFSGDGRHNHFRTEWTGGETWNWGLASPYEEVVS